MAYTDYDDVQDRWVGGGIPADESLVTTLIEDAEDLCFSAFPTLQSRIDSDTFPVNRLKRVVSRMVIRHLRNPQGYRSTNETGGPFQQQVTFGGEEPGALYLTEQDKKDLSPSTNLSGKAFSVDMTPDYFNPLDEELLWERIR